MLNNEEDKDISKILSKKYKKNDLVENIDKYNNVNVISVLNSDTLNKNNDIESFRKFYFIQTKKYFDGNTFYGLIHIRLAFFVKEKKKYENYIETAINKINNAINISDQYNNIKGKFYVYIDLKDSSSKSFSRYFLKKMANIMNDLYENQVVKIFITGERVLIKLFWPIISLFLDKSTKKKIMCLE